MKARGLGYLLTSCEADEEDVACSGAAFDEEAVGCDDDGAGVGLGGC